MLTSDYVEEACIVTVNTLFVEGSVSKSLGIPDDEEALKELALLPRTTAKDGLTIIAVDKTKNKVVGVAFNKLLVKNNKFFQQFLDVFSTDKAKRILNFILKIDEVCNVFEHCKIGCYIELLFLGTLPEYRQQGIAKKLFQLSIDAAQNLVNGVNVKTPIENKSLDLEPLPEAVMATLTSFVTQKMSMELGFTVAMECKNEELTGKATVRTPSTIIAYKLLNKA